MWLLDNYKCQALGSVKKSSYSLKMKWFYLAKNGYSLGAVVTFTPWHGRFAVKYEERAFEKYFCREPACENKKYPFIFVRRFGFYK